MTVDLEIVIIAVPGAFVRVSLSSVALLTGTHGGGSFTILNCVMQVTKLLNHFQKWQFTYREGFKDFFHRI